MAEKLSGVGAVAFHVLAEVDDTLALAVSVITYL
jgi:hypothetical protein